MQQLGWDVQTDTCYRGQFGGRAAKSAGERMAGDLPAPATSGNSSYREPGDRRGVPFPCIIMQHTIHEHVGSGQSRESCSKGGNEINRKTNQHLETEQTDNMEGHRPPGMLDHRQTHAHARKEKQAVSRPGHWEQREQNERKPLYYLNGAMISGRTGSSAQEWCLKHYNS